MRNAFLVWMTCLLVFSTESRSASDDIFKIPRDQILAVTHHVGLTPVRIDLGLPNSEASASALEEQVSELLSRAGISAEPSSKFTVILERLKKEAGGWYSPRTGVLDAAKRESVRQAALKEYIETYQLDAVATIWVDMVKASFFGAKAVWHDASESTAGKLGAAAFFEDFASGGTSGTLPALSIAVELHDRSLRKMYGRYGGLQLASLYIKGEFVDVAPDYLLSDPIRNAAGVRRALSPLLFTAKQVREQDEAARAKAKSAKATGEALVPTRPRLPPVAPALEAVPVRDATGLAAVRRVALAPLSDDTSLDLPPIKDRYESAMKAGLAAAGIDVVVMPDAYSTKRDAVLQSLGDLFDPMTGEMSPAKRDAIRSQLMEELSRESSIDAMVFPRILEVGAKYENQGSQWDGVTERILQNDGFWGQLADLGAIREGQLAALSLELRILDRGYNPLYVQRGGIQLLGKISGRDVVKLPAARLLMKPEDDARAVQAALRSLPGR